MIEILARHYQKMNGQPRPFDLIVLHSMQSSEKPGTARQVANWFASEKSNVASAHYCQDDSETILCVHEEDIAYGAPGANRNGIHIELAGMAEQSAKQWMDDYSRRTLWLAIKLIADIARRRSIPAEIVGSTGLIHGKRGITTHAFVSEAFKKSSHWDPGQGFPLRWLVGKVAAEI